MNRAERRAAAKSHRKRWKGTALANTPPSRSSGFRDWVRSCSDRQLDLALERAREARRTWAIADDTLLPDEERLRELRGALIEDYESRFDKRDAAGLGRSTKAEWLRLLANDVADARINPQAPAPLPRRSFQARYALRLLAEWAEETA